MLGFAILLLFNFAGLAASRAGVPLPGPVIGLILLTLGLWLGLIKLAWIEDAATFLLNHMALFFTPIIVGVLPLVPQIQSDLAPFLISVIVSFLAVLLTTGTTAQYLLPPAPPIARHRRPGVDP